MMFYKVLYSYNACGMNHVDKMSLQKKSVTTEKCSYCLPPTTSDSSFTVSEYLSCRAFICSAAVV